MAEMSDSDLMALVNSSRADALAAMSAINLSDDRAKAMTDLPLSFSSRTS
jgi:hypothetical protein